MYKWYSLYCIYQILFVIHQLVVTWILPSGYCEKGAAFIFEREKAEIEKKKKEK